MHTFGCEASRDSDLEYEIGEVWIYWLVSRFVKCSCSTAHLEWGGEKYQEEIHLIGRYCSMLNPRPDILLFKTAGWNLCKPFTDIHFCWSYNSMNKEVPWSYFYLVRILMCSPEFIIYTTKLSNNHLQNASQSGDFHAHIVSVAESLRSLELAPTLKI